MKLYSYHRSSAAYRVRIALNLKGLDADIMPVDLLKHGGEQFAPGYRSLHPDALVPVLADEPSGTALTQSLAIIEYLEERYPHPALLPPDAADRAWVRSIALSIACDIHPLNNLRVLRYLKRTLQADDAARDAWYRHWCEQGLGAIERQLAAGQRSGRFCFGDTPTLADCCLVPQVANSLRAGCDLSAMPMITRIVDACMELDAFQRAQPENQVDAP